MSRIGIVGGGVVGMCTAWYLHRSGHEVFIIDKGQMLSGCSWGNAGMIVPSHFVPLAAPGMISKGIRWMFNSKSPFYVRPRLDANLLRWGWHFYRNSTSRKVESAAPVLRDLSLYSKKCYRELASELHIELFDRGLLMLFRKQETGDEEMETVEMAHRLGIEARALSLNEVQVLEPHVRINALGAIYFPGDMHLFPHVLMTALRKSLANSAVQLSDHREVLDFQITGNTISAVETSNGTLSFDQVVLATGAWSEAMAKKLGLSIPVQAGKGYSFVADQSKEKITLPTLLLDDRVAVTPLEDTVRFGGTMEITGIDHSINMARVQGIVDAIPRYYPNLQVEVPAVSKVWHGLRPCSPDGLPFIGRSKRVKNLVVATGHGMMGISLGPGTGRAVADIVNEISPEVALEAMDPERFN